ncbi:MAG TPA: hypothetical protein VJR23_03675 [Candidatus Acidoferrales bacterium]|nr:hypothetical protein [Candidatus Acidoferrales bacterium]
MKSGPTSIKMQLTAPLTFDVFLSELSPRETVQWAGRPNAAVIFHKEDWGLIPFSLLWGGFAIFWLLSASGIWDFGTNRPDKAFEWFGVVWGTPFVLVGQYLIWGRFVYNRWKKQRTYYALTERRALIIVNGIKGRTASSAYFENTATIDKWVRLDGIGSISFGGPFSGEWRWGRNNPPRPPTFDDIDNVDSVYQLAARLREQAQKPGAPASSRW